MLYVALLIFALFAFVYFEFIAYRIAVLKSMITGLSSKIDKLETTHTSDADRWISLYSECEKRGYVVRANTSIFGMIEMIKKHDETDS